MLERSTSNATAASAAGRSPTAENPQRGWVGARMPGGGAPADTEFQPKEATHVDQEDVHRDFAYGAPAGLGSVGGRLGNDHHQPSDARLPPVAARKRQPEGS